MNVEALPVLILLFVLFGAAPFLDWNDKRIARNVARTRHIANRAARITARARFSSKVR